MSFKNRTVSALCWMACSALSAGAWAAGATPVSSTTPTVSPSTPASKGEEQALKWFRMLDINGDGRISRGEAAWITRFKPEVADAFKAADANRDGFVTKEEIRALADQRRAEREARRAKDSTASDKNKTPKKSTTPSSS
ncbi:EF-hand domain-containing protein [Ottowia caeni]|uniref:EF-hand domain-containing protein n=1 Tax=Ottowia caeni TaxID=2870339 RepID=UPI003D73FE21